MNGPVPSKTLRRVCAAEGYLELGMPVQALAELESIPDPGALAPHIQLLRGTSLMAQERYGEAMEPLQHAVRTVPAPYNRLAWWSLSKCFEHEGWADLANIAERFSQAPPEQPQQAMANLIVVVVAKQKAAESAAAEQG